MEQKIYRILIQSDIFLKGNNTPFTLYPLDMIICEVHSHSVKIITLKFKMSSVFSGQEPKDLQTLNLKEKSDGILRARTVDDRWNTINKCLIENIIEDITISYLRDEKLENLLYEE